MAEEKRIETIMPQENFQEAEEVVNFFHALNACERREFIGIIRGAKLTKDLQNKGLVNTA